MRTAGPSRGGQLMAPQKATEILTRLIGEGQTLRNLPWDSPKRDQWTDTARGVLERAFPADSSIFQNFGRAQAIFFSPDTPDEQMLEKVNSKLERTTAVLRTAVE